MNTKTTLAAALVAVAIQPALAEGRYGFRCSLVESGMVYNPPSGVLTGDHKPQPFLDPARVHVFVIDADKGVWRERFLGSDGSATPFAIDHNLQGDAFMTLAQGKVFLSGKHTGDYSGSWTQNNAWGLPGVTVTYESEGHCEEVAEIPDVDLPAKSFADRAKRSLNELVGAK